MFSECVNFREDLKNVENQIKLIQMIMFSLLHKDYSNPVYKSGFLMLIQNIEELKNTV